MAESALRSVVDLLDEMELLPKLAWYLILQDKSLFQEALSSQDVQSIELLQESLTQVELLSVEVISHSLAVYLKDQVRRGR